MRVEYGRCIHDPTCSLAALMVGLEEAFEESRTRCAIVQLRSMDSLQWKSGKEEYALPSPALLNAIRSSQDVMRSLREDRVQCLIPCFFRSKWKIHSRFPHAVYSAFIAVAGLVASKFTESMYVCRFSTLSGTTKVPSRLHTTNRNRPSHHTTTW